jgi:hypothetical protein
MIGESSRYTLPATSGVSNATFPGLANKIYNASFSLLARMSTRGEFAVCSRRQSPTIPSDGSGWHRPARHDLPNSMVRKRGGNSTIGRATRPSESARRTGRRSALIMRAYAVLPTRRGKEMGASPDVLPPLGA